MSHSAQHAGREPDVSYQAAGALRIGGRVSTPLIILVESLCRMETEKANKRTPCPIPPAAGVKSGS